MVNYGEDWSSISGTSKDKKEKKRRRESDHEDQTRPGNFLFKRAVATER